MDLLLCPFFQRTYLLRIPPFMGDRADPDPLQEILDELDSIRARERELLVQVSAILCEIIGDVPP